MLRPRIAVLALMFCAVSMWAPAQSASTSRHSAARQTPPVTITVDSDSAQTATPKNTRQQKQPADDPDQAADKAKKERIHALLDRAYALTEQLQPKERWFVMNGLLDLASREYPEKAVDWAVDTWAMSKDLPDNMRTSAQASVVSTIARIDPDKALDLLPLIEKDPQATMRPWPSMAATTVFEEVQRKHGESALPQLQKVARAMGRNGQYPYDAVASLIGRGWGRDEDAEPATEQAISFFRDAVQAYQSSDAHTDDVAFARFMSRVWRSVPRDLATQAVDSAARMLMNAQADPGFTGQIQVDNKSVTLQGSADAALVQVMHILKELDPAMLAKVVEAKPDFAGAENGRMNRMSMAMNPGGTVSPEVRQSMDRNRVRRQNMRLARTDPDQALAAAATMSNPVDKATLLADTARFMAQDSPDDAAKALDQAQKIASDLKDPSAELGIIVSSVQAARQLKQTQRVHELMARGFELGAQLLRQQMDDHPDAQTTGGPLASMNALVSFGFADDPDGVLAVIDAVPYPMAQAMLYTTAARSMASGMAWRGSGMGTVTGGTGAGPVRRGPVGSMVVNPSPAPLPH